MDEKLLSKLKKVYALAEQGVDGEAINATNLLHRLLMQHGLTIADLEQKGQEKPKISSAAYSSVPVTVQWKLDLAKVIAKHFFCHALIGWHKEGIVTFIGRPDHVENVQMLYKWLQDQILRFSITEFQKNREEGMNQYFWMVRFGEGVVSRLGDRLIAERDRMNNDVGATTLVVSYNTENSDYLEEHYGFRTDGKLTVQQERWKKQDAEDAILKATDIEAYYAKYPYQRPTTSVELTPEQEIAAKREQKKREERWRREDEQRRMEDALRPKENWYHSQLATAAGKVACEDLNLQPFIESPKEDNLVLV